MHCLHYTAPLWEQAKKRIPALEQTSNPKIVNSPDNFTPDGRWIIGETPVLNNYFVACGMNGNSLQVFFSLLFKHFLHLLSPLLR